MKFNGNTMQDQRELSDFLKAEFPAIESFCWTVEYKSHGRYQITGIETEQKGQIPHAKNLFYEIEFDLIPYKKLLTNVAVKVGKKHRKKCIGKTLADVTEAIAIKAGCTLAAFGHIYYAEFWEKQGYKEIGAARELFYKAKYGKLLKNEFYFHEKQDGAPVYKHLH